MRIKCAPSARVFMVPPCFHTQAALATASVHKQTPQEKTQEKTAHRHRSLALCASSRSLHVPLKPLVLTRPSLPART